MGNQKSVAELMRAFDEALINAGYCKSRLCNFRTISKRLEQFCDENGVAMYSTEVGDAFLQARYPVEYDGRSVRDLPYVTQYAMRTVRLLNDFYLHGVFTRAQKIRGYLQLSSENEEISKAFESYCRTAGCSESTVYRRVRDIRKFLNYLHCNNIPVQSIGEDTIIAFFGTHIDYSSDTLKYTLLTMRWFLKFLFETGRHKADLTRFVPQGASIKHETIPSVWRPEDVDKLLSAVDRGNPTGKRDYAILLLVTQLGLRVSDIKDLKLENINWEDNRISLVQSKTGENLSLPLLKDVGWAIIDYLRYGRPNSNLDNVFLAHTTPVMAFSATSSLGGIIKKYARQAKINLTGQKHGMHSLRHTLATRLLEQHTPLPMIAEILGHTSLDSVKMYLQVDCEHLRSCALNVEVE